MAKRNRDMNAVRSILFNILFYGVWTPFMCLREAAGELGAERGRELRSALFAERADEIRV